MSRLTELGTDELIFPCDCGDGDYLRIAWDDDPEWRFLWIEAHTGRVRWRRRIADAWSMLRGKDIHHSEVVMNDRCVVGLREFLADKVGK